MNHTILSHLPGDFPWQVHWLQAIDSTNDRAKAMAAQGAPHGTILIADQQTKGRGRMGRSFHSPGGVGLYLSVLLRPCCQATGLMHLTCAAAVAACKAVEAVTGFRPGIKWINDLVADSRKLGGILTELSVDSATGAVNWAVIGIGINCRQADFPSELQDIATSLETVTSRPVDRATLAAALIRELANMDQQLLSSKDDILETYRRHCVTLGKEVAVLRGDEALHGTALDIDADGGLIVGFSDGSVSVVNSGEVSVRGLYGYC